MEMSGADWQRKFSSIVKETENNLERIKQKIGATQEISGLHLNFNGVPADTSLILSDDLSRRPSNALPVFFHSKNDYSLNFHPEGVGVNAAYVPLNQSPSLVIFLNDKLEQQAMVIEQLAKSLQRNEEERDVHSRQLRDIKNEMYQLQSKRVIQNDPEQFYDHRFDKWKQEISSEFQSLNRKFSQLSNRDEDMMIHVENRNSSLSAAISDLQRYVKGECELLRQQMDLLHQRIGNVETDLMKVSRDIVDRPPAAQQDTWSKSQKIQANGFSNKDDPWRLNLAPVNSLLQRAPPDTSPLAELKQNYKAIQRKLTTLESNFKRHDSDLTDSDTQKIRRNQRSIFNSTSASDFEFSQMGLESSNPILSDDDTSDELTLGDLS